MSSGNWFERAAKERELDAEFSWILERVTLSDSARRWVVECYDNLDYTRAWEIIMETVTNLTPEVAGRMEALRARLGIETPPGGYASSI